MTIAQQLEQKGIAMGIEKGIEKGRTEGKREAALEIARTMLQKGFEHITIMEMTGLTSDDLAAIQH